MRLPAVLAIFLLSLSLLAAVPTVSADGGLYMHGCEPAGLVRYVGLSPGDELVYWFDAPGVRDSVQSWVQDEFGNRYQVTEGVGQRNFTIPEIGSWRPMVQNTNCNLTGALLYVTYWTEIHPSEKPAEMSLFEASILFLLLTFIAAITILFLANRKVESGLPFLARTLAVSGIVTGGVAAAFVMSTSQISAECFGGDLVFFSLTPVIFLVVACAIPAFYFIFLKNRPSIWLGNRFGRIFFAKSLQESVVFWAALLSCLVAFVIPAHTQDQGYAFEPTEHQGFLTLTPSVFPWWPYHLSSDPSIVSYFHDCFFWSDINPGYVLMDRPIEYLVSIFFVLLLAYAIAKVWVFVLMRGQVYVKRLVSGKA